MWSDSTVANLFSEKATFKKCTDWFTHSYIYAINILQAKFVQAYSLPWNSLIVYRVLKKSKDFYILNEVTNLLSNFWVLFKIIGNLYVKYLKLWFF